MSDRCPLCAAEVIYRGITDLECLGSGCVNEAPPERRPTPKYVQMFSEAEMADLLKGVYGWGWP